MGYPLTSIFQINPRQKQVGSLFPLKCSTPPYLSTEKIIRKKRSIARVGGLYFQKLLEGDHFLSAGYRMDLKFWISDEDLSI